MNGGKKLKIRELISRATYKTVKNFNREQMNDWAKMLYNDALRDNVLGDFVLHRKEKEEITVLDCMQTLWRCLRR